ncbi:MAG: methyltransferase domain-containing protein, partial [Candidatus Omnitrophica bacterium]|nr:methyltransferase domain-containing protein [Candidatus Omnitrophota bacterium]
AFLEEEIQRTLGRLDREKRWHILRALAARPQSLIRHLLPTPLSHLRRKGILLKKGYKRLVWKFAMRYYGNQLLAAYVRRWSEEIPPIARRGKNIIWGRKQYVDVAIRAIERGLAYDWLSLSSYKGQKNDPDKRLLYKAYMALAKQRSMEKKGRRPPPFRSLDELMKYAQKLVESQPSSSSPIETSSQGGKDMEWTPEEIEERWTAACNLAAIGNTLGPGAVLFISRHPELGFFLEYLIASAEPEGEGLYLSRTFVHQARLASEGLGFIAQRHPVTSERTLIIHSRKAGIVERSIAERRTAYRAGRKNELVILEPPIGEIRLSWFTAWMKQQIKSGDYNSDQQDVFVVEKIDQALQTYFDFLAASSPLASDGNRRTLGTAAHSVYGWRRLPLADTDARMLGTALQDVTRRQSSPVDARGKRGPPYDWLRKVGRRLERARKIQGISRKEFMAAMGVPEATAINYEHGHTNSRVSRWRKVESLLGISLRDLFDLSRPVPLRQTTVTADSPFPIMEIAGRKGYHTVVALARALKRDEVGLWALLKRAEEGSAGIGTLYELMRETEDLPVAPRLIRKKVSLPKPLSPEMKKLKFWLKIKKNVREGRKASRAEQVRDNFRVMKIHRPRHARVFSIYVGLSGRKRQTITYMAEHWRKIDPEAGQCSVTRALVWEMLDDARLMLLGEKKMLYRLSKQRRISSAVISQEKNQNRGAGVYKYCELKGGKVELKTGHLRFRGDKVVAKVLLSGICRADVKEIANSRTIIGKRPLFGHELVGEIVHVGDNARLSEGQRVVFNPNITNKRSTGFAEYLFIDSAAADEALIPIPERMRLTAAVLLEPFSCVLRSIEKLMEHMNRKNLKGLEVAIIGLGNAGSCFAILAKEFKAQRVAAFNMRDRRIPFAVKKGIIAKKDAFYLERTDEFKDKFDAVIVVPTKIDENILNKAVNLARKKGGYIHVYGGTMPREQLKVNFRQKDVCLQKGVYLHTLRIRERCQEVILGDKKIKLSGAYGTKTKNFLKAMGLAGRLEIEKTISGFITLDNLPEFISDMNSGKKDPVGKILVRVADASSPAASQEEDRKKVSVERKSLEWKKNRADWNWQAVIKIRYDGRRPGTLRDIAKETSKRGINIRYTDVRGEQAGKRVRTVTVEARRKKTIVELEKELALIEDYKDEEYERLAKHKWALEAEVLDRPSSLKEVAEICANMKIKMSECYQPEPPAGAKNATIVSELDVPEGADIEKLKVLLSGVVERLEIESGGLLNLIVMRFHKELYELMGTVEPWERRYIPRIVKLIAERHLGELRKDKRSIFVSHQLRGLKILVKEGQDNRPLDIFCYLLHDVIESGDATSWQLCEEFGAGVADIVWLLTREGKKTFDSEAVSLRKIVKKLLTETGKRGRLVSSISFCLKLVDRIDSLRTLEGTPRGFPAHIVFTTLNPFIHCLEPIKLGDIDARVRPVVERLLTLLYRETLLRCREFGFLDEEGNIIEKQFKRYRNAAIKAGELTKANMHDCTYEEYNSIIIKLLQFEKSTQPSVAGESSPKAGSPVERSAAEGVILPIQDEIDAFVKWFNSLLVRETWHLKGLRIDLAAGKNPESPNAFIFDDQQASVVINLGAMSEMKALYPLMDEIVSLWFTCEMERHSRDIWSGPEIAEITDAWHEWAEEVVYPLIPETEILGRKVIDIGTGTGHLPFYLEKKGASEAWGVDISSELIRRAQAAARQAGSKAVFLHGNAARLPQIPDGYFDTAACISSLSFMPHHIRSLVLKEIFRILKPDGRLYIFVYFTEYNTHRPRIDPRMHWTHEQWPRNLEKAGFVNVQPKSVVTNIVMSIPSYGALFISADKPEHVLQAASSPAMKSHPGSVIHSKLPQSHSRGVMGPSLSRRAFISRSLLGAAGLYLSSVYPQAWAPFQLQKPFPRLDDIWREILIHYNVFPGAKSHPKIIHEAVVNHYLYRAVAQHLGHAYYEPPAGLQGNGYFSDLMKGINKIYGDEVLVVDGHLNKVKPLHYGKFKNASRQLMLFFREKDSTYIALVNPKGQVEFNTHQNGISDFLDSDKAVVVEFGAMSDFFKLTQAEFEKKTGELDTLLRWFVEQYPDYKNRTAVFTPGHGGLEFKTTHYVTLKFKRHSRGIFMLWPASLTGKSHSRGVMGADASATKRGGSARHYGVPLRFPVGYVMFSSDNKGKTYGSSPV